MATSSKIENNYNNIDKSSQTSQSVILPDGRVLGYAEYGDLENGCPVFYFHGGQESRLSAAFMDETAEKLKIRIICPDRPGNGLSTFQPNRSFLDWSKDVIYLADTLAIDKFSIFGLSGGAPHVLACLHRNSGSSDNSGESASFSTNPNRRIIHASIIAGAAPYNYKETLKDMWIPVKLIHWLASRKNEKYLRKVIQHDYEELKNTPNKRMKQFQNYLPSKPDKQLMIDNPQYGLEFIKGSLESYRCGIDGVVQEWNLYVADWKMNLSSIHQHVNLWYGTNDKMAPPRRGLYYKNNLPHSTINIIDNEGHFSLIRNHLESILKELLH